MIHTDEIRMSSSVVPPLVGYCPTVKTRARLAQWEMGLFRAITCTQPSIPSTGTSAELMNTRGKIPVNAAACTASSFLTHSAIAAITHENVKLTAITSTIIASALRNPFSNEKPTR